MAQVAGDAFRELFLGFLADRERHMGSGAGGLHAYYVRRLQLGRVFNDGEIAAAELILRELPRYAAYVEIGAGFGQLAAWLAVHGVPVVAVERDRSRFDGLEAFRALVVRRWPEAERRFGRVFDAFPCALPEIDPARTLVVSTNLIFGASDAVERSIIDGIGACAAGLIDTLRFCRDRADPADLSALDGRFAAAGLPAQREVWPGGVSRVGQERIMWYRRADASESRTSG
jgi:hypothetical protein